MKNNNGYVSYNSLLIELSFRLGRDNLKNEETIIKRLIISAEHEINPYSSLVVKKKVTYHKGNGNFDGRNIVKPKDFFELDYIGSCKEGLCDGMYNMNQSFIILCDNKKRDSISFVYYGYACDGTGNPFTTINHREAVLAYLEYMFYKSKMHKSKGNMNMYRVLEQDWFDRCLEARGEDAMNEIVRDLDSLSIYNTATTRGLYNLDLADSCECSSACFEYEYDDNEYMNKKVKVFQYTLEDNKKTINDVKNQLVPDDPNALNQNSKMDISEYDLSEFINGRVVNFLNIGKYGFLIEDINSPNNLDIIDLTNTSLLNSFDKLYLPEKKTLIFFSKNLITHSSIFFKILYNGE
jgi:hypothetical protein